jgi:hypothetical protein
VKSNPKIDALSVLASLGGDKPAKPAKDVEASDGSSWSCAGCEAKVDAPEAEYDDMKCPCCGKEMEKD